MKKLLIAVAAVTALFGMQAASAQTPGASPAHSQAATPGAKGHHYYRGWSHHRHHRHEVLRHKARRHHHHHHP